MSISKEKLITKLGLKPEDFETKEASLEERLDIVENAFLELLGGTDE